MSSLGGRLWGVVAYESLYHNGSKFFLIRIIFFSGNCRDSCANADTVFSKSQNFRFLYLLGIRQSYNAYPFFVPIFVNSSGRLREFKNKRIFQTLISKSGRTDNDNGAVMAMVIIIVMVIVMVVVMITIIIIIMIIIISSLKLLAFLD